MAAVRKAFEKERDRNIVAEYYLKGYSTRAIAKLIADKVGNGYTVNHNTVSNDVKALLKEWQADRINDINDQKAIELQKLDKLEQTYWQAWEKSIEDHKKNSKKLKGKGDKPDYKELTETEVIAVGNPAFLAGIERCIDRRCKILGIDAPQKLDHTSGGKALSYVTAIEIVHTTKEEIDGRNQDAGNPGVSPNTGSLQHRPI